jgi:hypothetical protein
MAVLLVFMILYWLNIAMHIMAMIMRMAVDS